MSRDVAYRNGYLPLFAGAELVRRSGSLTQFPADNLIGTLPNPGGFRFRAPPELAGQPIEFGFRNSLYEQYQESAGILPLTSNYWPFTGYTPAGVVDENLDYWRLQFRVPNPEGGLMWTWRPGSHISTFDDPNMGVTGEAYQSTLTLSGSMFAPVGAVYPSGTFASLDDYLAACGMPALPNDDTQYFSQTHELIWQTPYLGSVTGRRIKQTAKSTGLVGASLQSTWESAFAVKPYPTELFDSTNSVQGLFGNIGTLYAQVYLAADDQLTEFGLQTKNLLHLLSPSGPIGGLSVISLPFRDPASLSPAEVTYLQTLSIADPNLMPGTVARQSIGFVGPSYKAVSVVTCSQSRNAAGVWSAESCGDPQDVGGLVAANMQNLLGSGLYNQTQTQLFLPTALVEQVFVSGT